MMTSQHGPRRPTYMRPTTSHVGWEDIEALWNEIGHLENKRQLKRSGDSMTPNVALKVSLLINSLKSNVTNKNVLITEVSFCAYVVVLLEHILVKRISL